MTNWNQQPRGASIARFHVAAKKIPRDETMDKEDDKLKHRVLINFNDLPNDLGGTKDGNKWYGAEHNDEICNWARGLIDDLPADVHIVATISGRMLQGITVCVAFAIQPLVDEIQYSGTNIETLNAWKREG